MDWPSMFTRNGSAGRPRRFRHGQAVEPCTEVKSYRLRVPAKKVLLISIAAPATFHVTNKESRGAAE